MKRIVAIVAFALVFASSVLAWSKGTFKTKPSVAIYPPQTLPLHFDHAWHLKMGEECLDCHEKAATSTRASDNLLPKEAVCTFCHPIDRKVPEPKQKSGMPPASCKTCHEGFNKKRPSFVPAVVLPNPNLKFSHKAHVDKKIPCKLCHGDMVANKTKKVTRDDLPTMSLCLQCHKISDARVIRPMFAKPKSTAKYKGKPLHQASTCATCHLTEPSGRLKTHFPSGKLTPSGILKGDTHGIGFLMQHKHVARDNERYCQSCHSKNYCLDCHNAPVKPSGFHRGNYLAIHGVEARRNMPDCGSCHRRQTFCTGCHSRSGVSADGRGSDFDRSAGRAFHPSGWNSFVSRDKNHHSFQAQRNIAQCASCHREDFCMSCHSRESLNVNPHPRGWAFSRRCNSLRRKAGRMCLRCHINPRELSCDWQAP